MKTLETDKRNFLFIAGVLFLGLTLIIGSSMAYAKSAQEINISVDITLEQFRQNINGGKNFLKSAKGVLVFPSVIKDYCNSGLDMCNYVTILMMYKENVKAGAEKLEW